MIKAVNYHLWQPCNMKCKFCFATFEDVKTTILPKGHLDQSASTKIIETLAEWGIEKITFAGGEPTLCPWLGELIKIAKNNGLVTMIVTNGTRLQEKWLAEVSPYLDWVTLSIDSLDLETNRALGRYFKNQTDEKFYTQTIQRIKDSGIRFKMNTVVTKLNYEENMIHFLAQTRPERWKIFQVLPIEGQNNGKVEPLLVTPSEFQFFVNRHNVVSSFGIEVVPEDNDLMTNSYVMVDPAGRFFDNSIGKLTYSQPILEEGIDAAFRQVRFDEEKFLERNGVYAWA